MRLFIGFEFNGAFKEELIANMEDLENESSKGNFTDEDNLHMTLAFLGEINPKDLPYVKEAMIRSLSDFDTEPLEITLGGFGSFKGKSRGRLYFRELQENERLMQLQRNLAREIRYQGFSLEDRKFRPHITIARNCSVYDDFDNEWFEEGLYYETMTVDKMILFESVSMGGKQVYTPVYSLKI